MVGQGITVRRHPARRGVAAVAMIIVLLILNLVIVGMVLGACRDQDISVRRLETVQAFYAAEAGMTDSDATRDIFDIFIIGGGVNGCGIARDAAGRGLKVGLAEKGDLASVQWRHLAFLPPFAGVAWKNDHLSPIVHLVKG